MRLQRKKMILVLESGCTKKDDNEFDETKKVSDTDREHESQNMKAIL